MAFIAATAVAAMGTACTGEPRPPVQDIENGIVQQGDAGIAFTDDQARCLADLYRDSDLSADYLEALAAGEQPSPSEDDREELAELGTKAAAECPPTG